MALTDLTAEQAIAALAAGATSSEELVHAHLDRHGDGWEGMARAVGSPNGWDLGMQAFAELFRVGGR